MDERWILKEIILNSTTLLNFHLHTRILFHPGCIQIFEFCLIFFFFFILSPRIENHSLELPHHWSSWRPTNSLQPCKEPRSPVSINLFQFWHKLVTSDDKHWPRCERTPSTSYQPSPGGPYFCFDFYPRKWKVLTRNLFQVS